MKFSENRPVKIVMLGAGGTGGHIAPHLYRLLYALERPVRFILCDGDIVEEKNLVRQNFTPADLGENKAKVLAERYSSVFGMETEYVPEFIESGEYLLSMLEPRVFRTGAYSNSAVIKELVILIGAVDNNKSRKLCHEVFYKLDDLIYIDSGNGMHTGQIVCGIRSGHRRRGHDLQHPDRRRNACAADHVCNGFCQYARHPTENKEESSMRSSVDAAAFYKAMTALMDIPAKSPVKVLQEIKAEFTADHCTLSATDFGTWLSVTIPASGDDFAFVFWNSAGVQKVCRYFTGQLELELSGQRKSQIITMYCGDKGGKFPVHEAEECPTWPEFEAKQSYTANAANILKCVKQVKYAVDLRSTRPEYQGVLFQSKHIWAVEGHRAACCDDGGLDVETPFLVGVSALEQLKVFGATDIQISVADNWVLFQNEHVRLLAKRILNVTPITYESVVPQKWNEEFCFHRKDFVQALKYLLACVGKADKPYVRFDNGALTLRTKECLYKAAVSISAESSIIFGFDARYMLDALTQFEKQDMVAMRLTSPLGAISLIADNSSAIVLPVRLKEEQKAA